MAVYLFGSHAKGNPSKDSDIDTAVLLRKGVRRSVYADAALKYTCDLIRLLKFDHIDIMILNSAGPIARHQVYHHGKLIFCRDKKEALRFKDLSISEYLDFLPFRRRAEERMFKRLRQGGARG